MILITGSNGFVGKELVSYLKSHGYNLKQSARDSSYLKKQEKEFIHVPTLDRNTDWSEALKDCDVVIHLAAMAHNYNGKKSEKLSKYIEHNVNATVNLANQAGKAGVKRFIFLSSTGVMGRQVTAKSFYGVNDLPKPHDYYTKSKLLAEHGLNNIFNKYKMNILILRAPVVYGLNAPGSIGILTKAIKLGVPLPFGLIENSRDLISINNLVDLFLFCISKEIPKNETFIISDYETISTKDLCYICGSYVGKHPKLLSLPSKVLLFISKIFGQQKKVETLVKDFRLDLNKTIKMLDWKPVYSPSRHIKEIKDTII